VNIFVANEQDLGLDEVRLSALARHTLESESIDEGAELSVLFVTSDHIQRLNARFAGENHATDVLAFPMMEDDEGSLLLGDVVICPQVAQVNATQMGHSLDAEVDALLVHGSLHLLGYDHQEAEDKVQMDTRVKEVLDSFDYALER
jgi:probable rRNA maturation factor